VVKKIFFQTIDLSPFYQASPSYYFEKVVYKRLNKYLDLKNIFSNSQYGFRPNHSTFMPLLDMYSGIIRSIDCSDFSIGVFIDLCKAFDTINHDIFFRKLEHYGVRGVPLKWFKNYLSNRYQYVYFNDAVSALRGITCGVPQGSILGPVLFLIYINDVVNCSKVLKFILFTDDTNLFYSSKSLIELICNVNIELE